jgi:hypothetical protein
MWKTMQREWGDIGKKEDTSWRFVSKRETGTMKEKGKAVIEVATAILCMITGI